MMKNNKIVSFLFAFFLMASFSSCLKESNSIIDTGNGNTLNVLEFKNTGDNLAGQSSKYPRFNKDLGSLKAGGEAKMNVNVSYSGVNTAPSDIVVTLGIDEAALATFNTQNGTNYVLPPADVYSFPTSVTIPKGQREVTTELTIKLTDSYDFNNEYAVPLKIESASPAQTISSNFGVALYSFSVRNIYDGVYTITPLAPMVDGFNPTGLTGLYPMEEMSLITFGGSSVALYDGQYFSNGYYHPIATSTGGVSAYGSFSPLITFGGDNAVVDVTNAYGQNSGALSRSGFILPEGPNKVVFKADGTVDYFEVWYVMHQGGVLRTTFKERFTRTGDRH